MEESYKQNLYNVAKVVTSGITFVGVCALGQFVTGRFGISASTPLLAPTGGLLTAGLGSIAACAVTDQAQPRLALLVGIKRVPKEHDNGLLAVNKLDEEEKALRALRTALMGAIIFRCLGGRFNCIAPSDVRRPGAFFKYRGTLKAGLDYASPLEKRRLGTFGMIYGCHTCGIRKIGDYIGDHMPPKKFALEISQNWWRRLIRVKQRFTPQCRTCSSIQSNAVRENKRILVYHYTSLRKYHATGAISQFLRQTVGDEALDEGFRQITHTFNEAVRRLMGLFKSGQPYIGRASK